MAAPLIPPLLTSSSSSQPSSSSSSSAFLDASALGIPPRRDHRPPPRQSVGAGDWGDQRPSSNYARPSHQADSGGGGAPPHHQPHHYPKHGLEKEHRPAAAAAAASRGSQSKQSGADFDPRSRYLDDDILFCPSYDEWIYSLEPDEEEPSQEQYRRYVREWNDRRIQFFIDRHWKEEWFLLRYDATLAKEIADHRHEALVARSQTTMLNTPDPIPSETERIVFVPAIQPNIPMAAVETALKATGYRFFCLGAFSFFESSRPSPLAQGGTNSQNPM